MSLFLSDKSGSLNFELIAFLFPFSTGKKEAALKHQNIHISAVKSEALIPKSEKRRIITRDAFDGLVSSNNEEEPSDYFYAPLKSSIKFKTVGSPLPKT